MIRIEIKIVNHISHWNHINREMAAVCNWNSGIPTFDPKVEPTSIAPRWQRWKRAFELFIVGKGITDKTQKRALLLHCAGMDVQDIFDTLPNNGEDNDYDKAIEVLDTYFNPATNVPYERHMFRRMMQEENETIDQFVTRLKQKSVSCDYGEACDEFIRDQVIDKCRSVALRRKLLEKGQALTLKQLQEISRAHEASYFQANKINDDVGIELKNEKINAIDNKRKGKFHSKFKEIDKKCFRCGKTDHFAKSPKCPAKSAECHKCHKEGHFASMCKTKIRNVKDDKRKINYVRDNQSGDADREEYAFVVNDCSEQDSGLIDVNVGGVLCNFLIDSGSTCNVVDRTCWEKLKAKRIKCKSVKSATQIYAYGSSNPLKVAGKFIADIACQGNEVNQVEFIVIEGVGKPLLGKKTAVQLGVLKIGPQLTIPDGINLVEDCSFGDSIKEQYPQCFKGIGKLKDRQLKIRLDPNVKPVAQKARRIPYGLQSKVEAKLDELESLGIIEKVEGPAKWASPLVIVPKPNGEIRLCTDMRKANEAIVREKFPIPTVDDILHEINGSEVFSKLDLRHGYHQLELDDESREITTTVTHKGHYRYTRLIFGLNNANNNNGGVSP